MRLDRLRQCALESRAVGERLPRYDCGRDAQFPCDVETASLVTIRDHHAHRGVDAAVAAGARHRFHVRAPPRNEDREAQGHSWMTTPALPRRTSPMRVAVSPRATSTRSASSACVRGMTAIMPMPQLKVRYISA